MLNNLKQNKLFEIFCNLLQIPSPSLGEENVIKWIEEFCKKNGIFCEADAYGNVFINVKAKNPHKKPILLSAHLDVVGDFSPVMLKTEGDFIKTDGARTLGADDKVGVACALLLALELTQNSELEHGGLEIVLTRDEEHGMSGIKHVDFKKLNSKYVIVLDADKLGQLLVSGASYLIGTLKVTTPYGGHSGIDIHDKHRLNAAKLIAELISDIPQGVFYKDEKGTITSINIGTIIAGNIQNTTSKVASEQIKCDNYQDYFIKNSITNVINTEAQASYSIRSADLDKENELKELVNTKITGFNKRYEGFAQAKMTYSQHLPPFEKTEDDLVEKLFIAACNKTEVKPLISSFHAGAETHIYAQNTNANGEKFLPFLLGLADVFNMHSAAEKVDYKTMLKGYELLNQFFVEFNLQ
ncbi:MAG: M20/M25/M40 family metallo-hydrolase [Candidatus Gastranaerophilales bacterium]|nr:M20/M25/M40 family metallo-hydrolase [Candidatus Gastranaerophilales bacterium]